MQSSKEKQMKFKKRLKVPTRPAEGSAGPKDTILGSSSGPTRDRFESFHAHWRNEFAEDPSPRVESYCTLRAFLMDSIAFRWALDPYAAEEEWEELQERSGGISLDPATLVDLLKRTSDYCKPAESNRRNIGAESVYLSFGLWSNMAVNLDGRNAVASTYRGLVLDDEAELHKLAQYNKDRRQERLPELHRARQELRLLGPTQLVEAQVLRREMIELSMQPFLVLLDLTGAPFFDADIGRLRLSIGATLAALRLDWTKVTTSGLQTLARGLPDSENDPEAFIRLQYISLKGLDVRDNGGVAALIKFPSLAAIDLRQTNMPGLDLFVKGINERFSQKERRHYHKAQGDELKVFALNLSLSSAYRRLRSQLQPKIGDEMPVPALVHVREMRRGGDYALPSVKSENSASRGVFTPGLGAVFATAPLDRKALLEDSEDLRIAKAFEIGAGAAVSTAQQAEISSSRTRLVKEESDTDVVDAEDALKRLPDTGLSQLLFRKVWHEGDVPLPTPRDVKPVLPGLYTHAHTSSSQRPSLEPAKARKQLDNPLAALLPSAGPSAPSRPLTTMASNSTSSKKVPARPTIQPARPEKKPRLSVFKKPSFSDHVTQ